MIKLSTASKFKQVGIFCIAAALLVIHIQAIPENENKTTQKTFASSNSGAADNAELEDHVKRALAEHKQKLRYNQVSAIVKPKHRLMHDNYSYMYASVWTAWSHWSMCHNQERIRVRACSVVRGHRCFGNNLESKPCKDQSITNSINSELLRNMAALKKSSLSNVENHKPTTNRPNVRAPQRIGPPAATPSPLYKANTVERNKLVIFSTDNKQANRQEQNPGAENTTNKQKLPALFSTPATLSEETSSFQKEPIQSIQILNKSASPSSTITTSVSTSSIAEAPTLDHTADKNPVETLKPNLHSSTANGKIRFQPEVHLTDHQIQSDGLSSSNELELQFKMETADWAPWSAWSNCECGQRTRTRTCRYSEAYFNSGCTGQSYVLEKCASTAKLDKKCANRMKT
ncbi:hypothetical protein T4B_13038 [Trichinella pseudospiralis]|uniref:Uncharacterized protein n=1 Tax=Trichinella pseudospiralis TaxID=6337 RepID=A0A0V1K8S3_TRIPS|nr:hypothetical protein T4B_13038 [Trichinella pseudospiralis]KRZ43613.1 hypothetical protein T4C_4732 [Trichinella pseudospiralis]